MILTQKQIQLVGIITRANPDGSYVDMDELIERTDYKPSKQSMQFSIRAMVAKGLIEKQAKVGRRGRQRVCYRTLPLGQHFFHHLGAAAFVMTPEEDSAASDLEAVLS